MSIPHFKVKKEQMSFRSFVKMMKKKSACPHADPSNWGVEAGYIPSGGGYEK